MQEYVLKDELVDGVKPTEQGWLWPAEDNGVWDGPKENWPQFKSYIQENVRGKKVVVQAGGACGMYPFLLSHMFETVYTFEPSFINFHCLVHNTPKQRIVKFNAALGLTHEMVEVVYADKSNVGTNTVKMHEEAFVPTLLIDDLDLAACDFIQLDIEGYEYNAIMGAQFTIKKFKPLISLENGHTQDLRILMESMGYILDKEIHADSFWKPL